MRLGLKVASTYSPTIKTAVPSAQAGLTSLFGMGRGGPCCNRHLKSLLKLANILSQYDNCWIEVVIVATINLRVISITRL
jgi:hypothetical protein